MQAQIIHGNNFFGQVADSLESDGIVLKDRNLIESKAHALFTQPLSNGQIFAHLPSQCNPIGLVTVLRKALEEVLDGKKINNPFIYFDQGQHNKTHELDN